MTSRLLTRIVTALAFTIAATVAAPQLAGGGTLPVPAGLTRWVHTTVYVHDATADPLVAQAVAEWDQLGVLRVLEQHAPCRPGQACVEVVHGPMDPRLGGWTWTTLAGQTITAAVVEINSTPVLPRSWAVNVRVHELGHALGLVHTTHPGSVMQPAVAGITAPSSYDAWMLAEAYAPR